MANQPVTPQQLINAGVDAETIEDAVNGAPEVEITSRLGRKFWTLATFDSRSQQLLSEFRDAVQTIVTDDGVPAQVVQVGDSTLDVFADDAKSQQDILKATSVNILDFLTKQQLKNWLSDNKSVDMTAALQAAYDHILTARTLTPDFTPLSLSGWGCGKIVLPKGRIYISSQILAKASSLGVIIEGQGTYTTSIVYNKDDGNLFKMTAYAYLTLSNLAILHLPISTNRADWTNKVFEISGQSGGRKFYLDRVAVHNFASVADYQFAVNEDTNQFQRCTFTNCKSVIRSRNSQAVVNNFNLCTFVGVIDRVFDISGYGYTSLRDCNIVVQGTTFYIANGNQGASSQYTLENVKWEWWGTGQASIIETEDLITNVCYFKLKNCGISRGVAPLASSYTFDIRCGRIQLEVDGGQWQEATMRLKSASTMFATNDSFIRFKDLTSPILPTSITYEFRAAGTSYIPIVFDNCREVDNVCLLGGGKLLGQARNLGAGNLRKSINTKTGTVGDIITGESKSHSFNFYGQTQYIESLRFIVNGYSVLTNCVVKVYKDAAKTQLICEQAIPDSNVFPQYEVIDFTLTDKISTEGVFIDITRDGTSGGIYGAIELITTAV